MVPLEGVFLPRHPLQFPWCCTPSAHASSASFPHWSKPTNSYRQDDWLLMWSSYSMPCSVRASDQCSIQFAGACKSISMHVHNHENVGVKYKLRIRGPGCVEKKCAKREEKYKHKIFWANEDEKEHSFHGNREGCVWNWQLVNAQPYNAHTCFCRLGGCNIDLHSVLGGLP